MIPRIKVINTPFDCNGKRFSLEECKEIIEMDTNSFAKITYIEMVYKKKNKEYFPYLISEICYLWDKAFEAFQENLDTSEIAVKICKNVYKYIDKEIYHIIEPISKYEFCLVLAAQGCKDSETEEYVRDYIRKFLSKRHK